MKTTKESISTSFCVRGAPENWTKYTTGKPPQPTIYQILICHRVKVDIWIETKQTAKNVSRICIFNQLSSFFPFSFQSEKKQQNWAMFSFSWRHLTVTKLFTLHGCRIDMLNIKIMLFLFPFLLNFFLGQDRGHGDVPPHLLQPCSVALYVT